MAESAPPWPVLVRLHEVQRGAHLLDLEADGDRRASVAAALNLVELKRLSAQVRLTPWLDGAELSARWEAAVVQRCGLSLEDFETPLSGEFVVRAVPAGSVAARETSPEVVVDPEAEDPPDVLEGDAVDVGGYLVEHLALELDPFPRKPGAVYAPPQEEKPASPFAVLAELRPKIGGGD